MNDERAKEGLAHLQQAMLEIIEAARAALDVAEDLIRDPSPLVAMASAAADAARAAAPPSAPSSGPGERPPPRVQHIRVS